jgi:hypothetical protein
MCVSFVSFLSRFIVLLSFVFKVHSLLLYNDKQLSCLFKKEDLLFVVISGCFHFLLHTSIDFS